MLNIVFYGIGILCSFALLRLNITYLGASLYGAWITITSIASWGVVGDLGIGNGLRNELSKAVSVKDSEKQLSLIKTALIMLTKVSIGLFLLLTLISESLIALSILDNYLRVPLYISNIFFCLSFILNLSNTIAYSYQLSWFASLSKTSISIITIVGVSTFIALSVDANLIYFALLCGISSALGNIIIISRLYRIIIKSIPNGTIAKYEKKYSHSIINIGLQFFILQLCGLILYSTDSIIINKIFNSESVTKYAIINSVYNAGTAVFSLLLISLWSAVTFVAERNDYSWIKTEVSRLLKVWGLFSFGVIVVSFIFNTIVKLWLGNKAMFFEPEIIFSFALFTILNAFGAIYVNVANGLGIVKLQMYYAIIGGVINIPLSILLAKYCGMGLSGIKIATVFCCFGSYILVPIQIIKYLNTR